MVFTVFLKMEETTTGAGSEHTLSVRVEQAENGRSIASNAHLSPLIVAGPSPREAIIEYIGMLFDSTTRGAEERND